MAKTETSDVGNNALVRQNSPTDMAQLKTVWSFCPSRAESLSTFMTGNKWLISDLVNAPIVLLMNDE